MDPPQSAGSRLRATEWRSRYDAACQSFGASPVANVLTVTPRGDLAVRVQGHDRLTREGVAALAETLKATSGGCGEVELRDCFLGDEGATLLCDALRSRPAAAPPLRRLSVAGCRIGAAGARALAALLGCGCIEELDLEWNELGSAQGSDWGCLCDAMVRSAALQRADLRSNRLGPEHARALAAALARQDASPKLTAIDLRWNRLGSEGARALCAALERNTALVSLPFSGNDAHCATVGALDARLRANAAAAAAAGAAARWDPAGAERSGGGAAPGAAAGAAPGEDTAAGTLGVPRGLSLQPPPLAPTARRRAPEGTPEGAAQPRGMSPRRSRRIMAPAAPPTAAAAASPGRRRPAAEGSPQQQQPRPGARPDHPAAAAPPSACMVPPSQSNRFAVARHVGAAPRIAAELLLTPPARPPPLMSPAPEAPATALPPCVPHSPPAPSDAPREAVQPRWQSAQLTSPSEPRRGAARDAAAQTDNPTGSDPLLRTPGSPARTTRTTEPSACAPRPSSVADGEQAVLAATRIQANFRGHMERQRLAVEYPGIFVSHPPAPSRLGTEDRLPTVFDMRTPSVPMSAVAWAGTIELEPHETITSMSPQMTGASALSSQRQRSQAKYGSGVGSRVLRVPTKQASAERPKSPTGVEQRITPSVTRTESQWAASSVASSPRLTAQPHGEAPDVTGSSLRAAVAFAEAGASAAARRRQGDAAAQADGGESGERSAAGLERRSASQAAERAAGAGCGEAAGRAPTPRAEPADLALQRLTAEIARLTAALDAARGEADAALDAQDCAQEDADALAGELRAVEDEAAALDAQVRAGEAAAREAEELKEGDDSALSELRTQVGQLKAQLNGVLRAAQGRPPERVLHDMQQYVRQAEEELQAKHAAELAALSEALARDLQDAATAKSGSEQDCREEARRERERYTEAEAELQRAAGEYQRKLDEEAATQQRMHNALAAADAERARLEMRLRLQQQTADRLEVSRVEAVRAASNASAAASGQVAQAAGVIPLSSEAAGPEAVAARALMHVPETVDQGSPAYREQMELISRALSLRQRNRALRDEVQELERRREQARTRLQVVAEARILTHYRSGVLPERMRQDPPAAGRSL